MQLSGLQTSPGVIRDLSSVGALFVPDTPVQVDSGTRGSLRFGLPTSADWLEPSITIRRFTTFIRTGGLEGQALGLEFSGLRPDEEETIVRGCAEWDSHRMRQYTLAARCFAQTEGSLTAYARFGQLIGGTRSYLRVSLPAAAGLSRGARLQLKIARTWVKGEVEQTHELERGDLEVLLRMDGWGRDFFLHEARRQSGT